MGHEVSDRYYKLGSSVDITCQVALSFLNTIPSPARNSNDRLLSTYVAELTTKTNPTTTTVFPFIDMNLIKKAIEQQIPYTGNHNIKWRKDGKDLPKDIKINLRFVCRNQISHSFFFHTLSFDVNYHLNYSFYFSFSFVYVSSTTHSWRNSRISIIHAEKVHSGTYSCSIDNTTSSTVNIQILMGRLNKYFLLLSSLTTTAARKLTFLMRECFLASQSPMVRNIWTKDQTITRAWWESGASVTKKKTNFHTKYNAWKFNSSERHTAANARAFHDIKSIKSLLCAVRKQQKQ